MGIMIPLGDASRSPLHRSVVTAVIILVNALVFVLEVGPLVTVRLKRPAPSPPGYQPRTAC